MSGVPRKRYRRESLEEFGEYLDRGESRGSRDDRGLIVRLLSDDRRSEEDGDSIFLSCSTAKGKT